MTKILNGKTASQNTEELLAQRVSKLQNKPVFTVVQGGTRPDSCQYIKNKKMACERIGIKHNHIHIHPDGLHHETYIKMLAEAIMSGNQTDGVILQVPVEFLSFEEQESLIALIDPSKDVDGLTTRSKELFYSTTKPDDFNIPCTPLGIIRLLDSYSIDVRGKNVCIIGRSEIVGRPMSHLMLSKNATVTVCHSKTKKNDMDMAITLADILIVAVGIPNFINIESAPTSCWGHKTVIDVGINRQNDKWVGDIDNDIKSLCRAYTPVPCGIGPMTISALMEKIVISAERKEIDNGSSKY